MKKLNKLCINSEKLMKDEELMTLRGGYGYVCCYNGQDPCGSWYCGLVGSCGMADDACDKMCGPDNWDNHICSG